MDRGFLKEATELQGKDTIYKYFMALFLILMIILILAFTGQNVYAEEDITNLNVENGDDLNSGGQESIIKLEDIMNLNDESGDDSHDSSEKDVIYLDGENGDDSNDGGEHTPLATVDKAYELVKDGGTIILLGDTVFAEGNYYAIKKAVTFKSNEPEGGGRLIFQGKTLSFIADTTFENIELENQESGARLFANGHNLTFGEGFKLTERYLGGTGLVIVGGGLYGDKNIDSEDIIDSKDIKEGGTITLLSGEFGEVFAGPSGVLSGYKDVINEDSREYIEVSKISEVLIKGAVQIRSLYSGYNADVMITQNVKMTGSQIRIEHPDAEIKELWGGNSALDIRVDATQEISQEQVEVELIEGQIGTVYAGSLVGGTPHESKYTVGEFILEVTGGTIDEILSGGLTIGFDHTKNWSSTNKVGQVTIKTSIPLTGKETETEIFSSGNRGDAGFGLPEPGEKVVTDAMKLILTEEGSIEKLSHFVDQISTVDDTSEYTEMMAARRTISFDNPTALEPACIPEGFNEIEMNNGSKALLEKNLNFTTINSSGESSKLVFQEVEEKNFPTLSIGSLETIEKPKIEKPIIVDFITRDKEETIPSLNQILIGLTDPGAISPTSLIMNSSNPGLVFFSISRLDNDLVVSKYVPNRSGGGRSREVASTSQSEKYKLIVLKDGNQKDIEVFDTGKIKLKDKILHIESPVDLDEYDYLINLGLMGELEEDNKNGKLLIELPNLSYKLPFNLPNNVTGLKEYIKEKDLSHRDLSIQLTIKKLRGMDLEKAKKDYEKAFSKGELLSEFYDLSIRLLDKDGRKIDFDMNKFENYIEFTIGGYNKSGKNIGANAVLFYKDGKFYFTPASFENNKVNAKTRHHSSYVVSKNNSGFKDVEPNTWYYLLVNKAANKALITGVDARNYNPKGQVTRAEFIQMMVNAVSPKLRGDYRDIYSDVKPEAWYYDSIKFAKKAGWLDKFVTSDFKPNQAITREEMATILSEVYRQENPNLDEDLADLGNTFLDYNKINKDYLEAVNLIYKLKIMQGVGNNKFEPEGLTTRAQAATVQINLLESLDLID